MHDPMNGSKVCPHLFDNPGHVICNGGIAPDHQHLGAARFQRQHLPERLSDPIVCLGP